MGGECCRRLLQIISQAPMKLPPLSNLFQTRLPAATDAADAAYTRVASPADPRQSTTSPPPDDNGRLMDQAKLSTIYQSPGAQSFKTNLMASFQNARLMANFNPVNEGQVRPTAAHAARMGTLVDTLMLHLHKAADRASTERDRVTAFESMINTMHRMTIFPGLVRPGLHRAKRDLIVELRDRIEGGLQHAELFRPAIDVLPLLPKDRALFALKFLKTLMKRSEGTLKDHLCADLARQIAPLYQKHIGVVPQLGMFRGALGKLPSVNIREADKPSSKAAEILVRFINTYLAGQVPQALVDACKDAARAQENYYRDQGRGKPVIIDKAKDIKAAILARASDDQRETFGQSDTGLVIPTSLGETQAQARPSMAESEDLYGIHVEPRTSGVR